jgi:hypothetical protein
MSFLFRRKSPLFAILVSTLVITISIAMAKQQNGMAASIDTSIIHSAKDAYFKLIIQEINSMQLTDYSLDNV